MSNDDYFKTSTGGWQKRGRNLTEAARKRGASSDPKKCTHPDDRGRTCTYCGVYVRGDDMG